jgi:hypothetical protein
MCVTRNKRKALLALLFSCVLLTACLRDLHKPFNGEREPVWVILGITCVIGLMTYLIARIRCWHERLWLGLAATGGLVVLVKGLFPVVVAPAMSGFRGFVRSAFRSTAREASPPDLSSQQDGG